MASNYAASMMSKRGAIERAAASLASAANIEAASTWAEPEYRNRAAATSATGGGSVTSAELASVLSQLLTAIKDSSGREVVVRFDSAGMAHALSDDMDRELRMKGQVF